MGNLFNEIKPENFPTLCIDLNTHVQEVFQTPNRYNQKRITSHHKIFEMPKLENKARILKTAREKYQLTYKGNHIRITSDLSTNPKSQESMEAM
jgi:hypothetical protein